MKPPVSETTPAMAVARILSGRSTAPRRASVEAFAPANIALCKYWGKRPGLLNLPVTSSLSLSLGERGSRLRLSVRPDGAADVATLNGAVVPAEGAFLQRASAFLDLLCGPERPAMTIEAENTIPTAAGFASSASGFAALTRAVDALMDWRLTPVQLSMLARMGSGSACRSLYHGFVHWYRGEREDGMDCFAEPVEAIWTELRLGLVVVEGGPKATGSTEGMLHTQRHSPLYSAWPALVEHDLRLLREAIVRHDFDCLGALAEGNAMAMHATMLAARPSLCYWTGATVELLRRVWDARNAGLDLYATMDAGPNVKILFLERDREKALSWIPAMEVVNPWRAVPLVRVEPVAEGV